MITNETDKPAATTTTQQAQPTTPGQAPGTAPPGQAPKSAPLEEDHPDGVKNTIMDLHLELLYMFHRVCLKLAQTQAPGGRKKSGKGSDKGSAGPGGRATSTKQKTVKEQKTVNENGWERKFLTRINSNKFYLHIHVSLRSRRLFIMFVRRIIKALTIDCVQR